MGTLMTLFLIIGFFRLEVRVAFLKIQKENVVNPCE